MYGLGSKVAKITFFLFPACVNLTSIPVFSIMQRYNLVESGACGPKTALAIAVGVPWLVAIPLYTGKGYELLVTWSGIVVTSVVNFVVPPILYILALRKTAQEAEKKAAQRALTHTKTAMTANSGLTHEKLEQLGAPSANGGAGGGGGVTSDGEGGGAGAPVKRSKSSAFASAAIKVHTQHRLGRIDTTVLTEGSGTPGGTSGGTGAGTGGPDSAVGDGPGTETAVVPTAGGGGGHETADPPAQRAQSLGRRLSLLAHSATQAAKDVIRKSKKARRLAAAKEERAKKRELRKKQRMKEPEEAELMQPPLVRPSPWTFPTSASLGVVAPNASAATRRAALTLERAWWCLSLPTRVAMHYTIPHASSFHARSSVPSAALGVPVVSQWRLVLWVATSLLACLAWSGGLTYMLLWCATQFCDGTTFHPFLFGLYVLGVGLRLPALLTEVRGYRAGQGDLNRVFLNNVLQIIVCVPVPWIIHQILHNGQSVRLYSGDITVLSLSLFIMGAMIAIIFRSYNWIADRKVVAPIAAVAIFFAVEAGLVDYQVILDLKPECDPTAAVL
jgi:hypothetical protein